ncbi:TPA: hypothetical protein ACGUO9_004586 [Vibrio vulnificus]
MKPIFTNYSCAPNKAFKWDSCRMAFLVCREFCGESGLRKAGLGGIHPLTQRYTSKETECSKGITFIFSLKLVR